MSEELDDGDGSGKMNETRKEYRNKGGREGTKEEKNDG